MPDQPKSKALAQRFFSRLQSPSLDLPPIPVKMPAEYKLIQPYLYEDLMRLGILADGGYVVPQTLSLDAQTLVSLGLALEWSFEHDFAVFNPRAKIYGYDHTTGAAVRNQLKKIYGSPIDALRRSRALGPLRWLKTRLTGRPSIPYVPPDDQKEALQKSFIRRAAHSAKAQTYFGLDYLFFWRRAHKHISKKVTQEKGKGNISLEEIFDGLAVSPVFLKIDIEGSEYETIDAILQHAPRISAMVIEFHEIDQAKQRFLTAIERLNEKFAIIHVHGNNYAGLTKDGVPDVLEVTFIPKEKLTTTEKRTEFPVACLDYPNLYTKPDYALQF